MKTINLNEKEKRAKHHNIDVRWNEIVKKKDKLLKIVKLYRIYLYSYMNRNNSVFSKMKFFIIKVFIWNLFLKRMLTKKSKFDSVELLKSVYQFKQGYTKKIPYLNLFITRKCNLNCKGCGALMPLYNTSKEKQWYMSIENIERILHRYNELCGGYRQFDMIDIVGGEPLMHPQLEDVFAIIRKYNPNASVVIITNGLLLDKIDEKFFWLLEKYKIKLSLSIYGHDCYFEKINISDDVDIAHDDCSSCSGHVPLYFSGMNSVSVGGVTLAENGDLFYCGFNAITKFNEYFKKDYKLVYGSDYVNIFNVKNFDEVLEMMNKPRCSFSKYCKGRKVFQWDISSFSENEWQFSYNKIGN
jgi:hypothetical protein